MSGRRPPARPAGWIGYEAGDEPRVPLTSRRIVETAVAQVDEHGLAALSIRPLAAALGVTPMAIYGHVSGKEHLLDLMLDLVLGEVDLEVAEPASEGADPLLQARVLIVRVSRVFERHRGMARIYGGSVVIGPNGLKVIDAVMGHLLAAGFDPQEAAAAFMALYTFTMGHHQIGGVAGPEHALTALAPDQVPHVTAAGRHLFAGASRAERFEHGLDLMLAGLRASRVRRAPAPRR
ncbi:MAG: TetR/AcrR family transcriptional regulator C-terminal domain-containing protein [Acidimicrobiales bacterium]